ncbi:MAG: MBL fold metallo-hydrolase [Actinomycetia bacterium]|nr:MBL fold metallo-hydrolase [Actinomycetes bacterium]MCP3911194.1 MBL fold metallo-hydrolase [Actinomycetes bacterium]MCP4083470.1 MBL fold metallo-hydrolase [Actinomycetes bacterium]
MVVGPVTVLTGIDNGRYPHGNSIFVEGSEGTLLVDPSLTTITTGGPPAPPDQVFCSHAHEDHVAGLGRWADAPVLIHEDDLHGVTSLDGLLDIYGFDEAAGRAFRQMVEEEFEFTGRPDATGIADGHVIDLGDVKVDVLHLPGHTRGHAGIHVEASRLVYLADIDLTGFGPYYGDAWSDLEDFERTLERCRDLDAEWFSTFHHKGVVQGRGQFLPLLEAFIAVIERREIELLAYLGEPRTVDDIVSHRFVYRPQIEGDHIDSVEHRSMTQHLVRLERDGQVHQVEPGHYRAG